jgi:aspartyl-tRNA(Asn)/glutamyl-tRNA(Gln) amidotransferase subunit A
MLNTKTAHELLDLINKGKIKQKEILSDVLSRIDKVEPEVKAYAHLPQNSPTESSQLPLKGIPVAIKDNICTKESLTTCSSHILDGFKAPYDASVIERLKENGALVFGKTNMDEFAFGSSCETSYYGPTRNPWDLDRVPGGSSGGSAAAVAADEAIWALGSDTGGSIRQPAALCGVVGLKPTYGRVSRYGLIAFASSLDQIGPITKDVRDCALLLSIISGHDRKDSTSVDMQAGDYLGCLEKDIKGMKIAIPKEYFIEGLDKQVEASVSEARSVLEKQGAIFKEVNLPQLFTISWPRPRRVLIWRVLMGYSMG